MYLINSPLCVVVYSRGKKIKMKKSNTTVNAIKSEKNNIWAFITLLTELATASFVAVSAYYQSEMVHKIGLAIIASVLIVNLLAKLYALVRK